MKLRAAAETRCQSASRLQQLRKAVTVVAGLQKLSDHFGKRFHTGTLLLSQAIAPREVPIRPNLGFLLGDQKKNFQTIC